MSSHQDRQGHTDMELKQELFEMHLDRMSKDFIEMKSLLIDLRKELTDFRLEQSEERNRMILANERAINRIREEMDKKHQKQELELNSLKIKNGLVGGLGGGLVYGIAYIIELIVTH